MFIHQQCNRHRLLLTLALCIAVLFVSLLSSCEDGVSRHSLSFDANGGEGAMVAISLKEGEKTSLPACSFTKSGYVFAGWSTAKDATSADLSVGSSYSMAGQDVTLYAIWSPAQFIEFSSSGTFTLRTQNRTKNWTGQIEYSTNGTSWITWTGNGINSSDSGHLYLRGTGNTTITDDSNLKRWVFSPSSSGQTISCTGNIETLLDYIKVFNGEHPIMNDYCYAYLFQACVALTTAPELPATELSKGCYSNMFASCTSLERAPVLPATQMAVSCYNSMFEGCSALTTAPELKATGLAESCYKNMFLFCTKLESAPTLPATQMAKGCYSLMFAGCSSLERTPALPATMLAESCYNQMFYNCTALNTLPLLPATQMANFCYQSMFQRCTNIMLSKTQTFAYPNTYRLSSSGTGGAASQWNRSMFAGTGGDFKDDPTINTPYYTSNEIITLAP